MMERLLTIGWKGQIMSLLILVLLSLAAWQQITYLEVDRSDDKLISPSDPGWRDLRRMETDFGVEETALIYIRDADLWTTERLLQLQKLTFDLEDTPQITSVSSVLSATNIRDKGDYVVAEPLVGIVPNSVDGIAEIKSDALYSSIMRHSVISDDAQSTAIRLGYRGDTEAQELNAKIYAIVEALIEPLRNDFDVILQLGSPRLEREIDTGLFNDLKTLIPAAVLIMIATIAVFLKSLRTIPIPLITTGISILWTLGFMATTGIPLTLLTAMVPALIIVIGSTEDVHMIIAYLDGLAPEGHAKKEAVNRRLAVEHMARRVGVPILITSLTTAVGFVANTVSEIPLIREFAMASAFAMVANLIVTVLALPLQLTLFGPKVSRLSAEDKALTGVVGGILRFVERVTDQYPMIIVGAFASLLIILGMRIPDVRVNNDPLSYFRPDHPFVVDATQLADHLSGLQIFSLTLNSPIPEYFRTVEGVSKIADAQALLDSQALYDKTQSFADIVKMMHQEMHKGDTEFFNVPTDQEDLDLYIQTFSRDDIESFVTEDYSRARIMVRHNVSNSLELNQTLDALQTQLRGVLGERVNFALTGKNLMVNRAAEQLISGQLSSLLLVLTIIFLLFSILYTSILAGLLALVPNVIPVVLSFGAMGMLGVPLNPATAMVAAIVIGIAVDDTIHLMTRFGVESRRHLTESEATRATIRGQALPIISTSLALALGFSVLAFSSFSVVVQFGLLAAAAMIYAMVADLLLMPILLRRLRLATVWDIIALKLDRDVLIKCPLFQRMSPYQIKKVALLSHMQDFEEGEIIIEHGERSSGMYVLLKGSAQIQFDKDDLTLDIDALKPGDVFGEIGFSGEDVERIASVVTMEPVSVVRLDASSTQKGLRFYPRLAARLHRNIGVILGMRLVESHNRLADAVSQRAG
jgi:predicted RND superfamily exporter protein